MSNTMYPCVHGSTYCFCKHNTASAQRVPMRLEKYPPGRTNPKGKKTRKSSTAKRGN